MVGIIKRQLFVTKYCFFIDSYSAGSIAPQSLQSSTVSHKLVTEAGVVKAFIGKIISILIPSLSVIAHDSNIFNTAVH